MAVVVQQTSPFPPSTLQLDHPARWTTLLPLLRPSVKSLKLTSGPDLLVDSTKLKQSGVAIVAVPVPGRESSALLDKHPVAAIVLGVAQGKEVSLDELEDSLSQAGYPKQNGLVIIQPGEQHRTVNQNERSLYVQCNGTLGFDHILHLLCASADATRASKIAVAQLLERFDAEHRVASAEFAVDKVNGQAALKHQDKVHELTVASDALQRDLTSLLDVRSQPAEGSTWLVHFADTNGLSRLEIYIAAATIGSFFESRGLAYRLSQSSIVDYEHAARGYAISLSAVPSTALPPQSKAAAHAPTPRADAGTDARTVRSPRMQFKDSDIRQRIVNGCEAVIKAEPAITEYDTIVGDGDCGYTLRDGAKQVLQFIKDQDMTGLPHVVDALVQDLEINMGGTSGALYCIFLTALAASLASESSIPEALQAALDQLLKYTRARLGDRTMMDALIPFVETLNKTGDAPQAVSEARKGVEGTKKMEAKLGRSTYLDESATQGVPDPGAYGLLVLLEGMAKV